jgi:HemY protein
MRTLLWFLALFGIAVAIALFAGNNQGTITVFWPPHRIDLSLNLVLLLLLGFFFTLYVALRALSVLLALPGEARRWRMSQRERALQQGLLDAWAQLLAGRFIRARKSAENLLVQEQALASSDNPLPYGTRLRAMAHLLAAESAHALLDRSGRDAHARHVLSLKPSRDDVDIIEGAQLRATRWALADRDVSAAFGLLGALPKGIARRTLALRLRFKAERLAGHTQAALESARLLAKHRAFSPMASQSILQGLARELIQEARDPAQLKMAWAQLERAEQLTPEVATQAADQMLRLGGEVRLAQQWLLPVWEQMLTSHRPTLSPEQATELVRVLDRSFAQAAVGPDADWLARIETAQLSQPGNALLQYLAGFTCLRLKLWGKAQQLLTQSIGQLQNEQLQGQAWVALAQLAQQRDDAQAEIAAWRQVGKIIK